MAIRLLPFRDYDEHDVVNLYRMSGALGDFIDLSNSSKQSTARGDAGVFVKVAEGTLGTATSDWDPIDIQSNPASLLGKTDYPHIGANVYPQTSLSVEPVGVEGDACIGVTLRQTVEKDENGENLLYNPVKKDELFGVLPGEAVPVLSKGMITISDDAVQGTLSVGDSLVPSTAGTVSGVNSAFVGGSQNKIGTVLAKGHRGDNMGGGTNVFGQAGAQSGDYYIVKIDCA